MLLSCLFTSVSLFASLIGFSNAAGFMSPMKSLPRGVFEIGRMRQRQASSCTDYGANYVDCGYDGCYDPTQGQVCCGDGDYCDAGTYCEILGCCPNGLSTDCCEYGSGCPASLSDGAAESTSYVSTSTYVASSSTEIFTSEVLTTSEAVTSSTPLIGLGDSTSSKSSTSETPTSEVFPSSTTSSQVDILFGGSSTTTGSGAASTGGVDKVRVGAGMLGLVGLVGGVLL